MEWPLCLLIFTGMRTRHFPPLRISNCLQVAKIVQTLSFHHTQASMKRTSSNTHRIQPAFPATHRKATRPLTLQIHLGMKKYSKMLSTILTCWVPHLNTAKTFLKRIKQRMSRHPIVWPRLRTQCCMALVRAHLKKIFHSQVWINRSSFLTKNSNRSDPSLHLRKRRPLSITKVKMIWTRHLFIPFSAWPKLME